MPIDLYAREKYSVAACVIATSDSLDDRLAEAVRLVGPVFDSQLCHAELIRRHHEILSLSTGLARHWDNQEAGRLSGLIMCMALDIVERRAREETMAGPRFA